MNEWEEKVLKELLSRGFNSTYAKHVAAFVGSLYLKNFGEVCETLDVISSIIGYKQHSFAEPNLADISMLGDTEALNKVKELLEHER